MSVLVVGSMALDTIETPHGRIQEGLGGSATHFSAAASFFTKVKIVAVVGKDFPEKHVNFLRSRGVDVTGLSRVEGNTFRWSGVYSDEMNEAKTLRTELNVFKKFRPELAEGHRRSGFVFLANIDPDLQRNVLEQISDPHVVALDTMNYWIESKPKSLKRTLQKVDILLINEGEAKLLARERNLFKAAKSLISMGPSIIVLKRAAHGAFLIQEDDMFWAPAYPLESVKDPTGAGDSFAGGFMGYISRRRNLSPGCLRRAVIYGSIMASFCVEDFSLNRMKKVTPSQIHERFLRFRDLTRF
jgi:sugar/nucleoside kinase (ribokinase family)